MATMVICQIMLVLWKKHYFESYQAVTLVGMWLIPLYFSIELLFYRMLFFWALFTICTVGSHLTSYLYMHLRTQTRPVPHHRQCVGGARHSVHHHWLVNAGC